MDGNELREPPAPYNGISGPENEALGFKMRIIGRIPFEYQYDGVVRPGGDKYGSFPKLILIFSRASSMSPVPFRALPIDRIPPTSADVS